MHTIRNPSRIRGNTNVWLVGCLSALALAAIAGVILFFIVKSTFDDYIDTYTSTEMRVFPPPTMTAEEARPLIDDFKAFKTAMENGETPDAFTLTTDEINALLSYDEDLEPLSGMARVDIVDDQIQAEVSVPLGLITDLLEGQYLNGSGIIIIEMRDDRLQLFLDQLEVKGEPVPEDIMAEIRKENIGEEISNNPDAQRLLKYIESITVGNDRLVIMPKAPEER